MEIGEEIYRGGFYSLLKGFEKSQRPYKNPLAYLPAVDCDLDELEAEKVQPPDVDVETYLRATIER